MTSTPEHDFQNATDLRTIYGPPVPASQAVHIDYLHPHYCQFIRLSPFAVLATASADGQPSVSPKGDGPGFAVIQDARTLVLPDRPGNNKLASLSNLMENSKAQLMFFIPCVSEVLRVNGDVRVSTDPAILELGRYRDKLPISALVMHVREAFIHCGKAVIRAGLWTAQAPTGLPSLARIIQDVNEAGRKIPTGMNLEELEALFPRIYADTLY
jgi:uncharacterized protein